MKKDAYYFPHDSNAKDDPKLTLVIDQLGLEGYGIFFILIELLREQPEYKYPLQLLPSLARKYATTHEKIKTVVYNYNLFEIDEVYFKSLSLIRRMIPLEKNREQRKEAVNARWEKERQRKLSIQQNNDIDTTVSQPNNGTNTTVIQSKVEESREEEIRLENIRLKEIRLNKLNNSYKKRLLSEIKISDIPHINEIYFNAAISFRDLIIRNLQDFGASTIHVEKTKGSAIDEIRKIIEIDKHSIENLRKVFAFLENEKPKGEFSWKKNILSFKTLREKFNKLVIDSQKTEKNGIFNTGATMQQLADIVSSQFADLD
jgi:hypothetical protein